jgi:hypothetical protein
MYNKKKHPIILIVLNYHWSSGPKFINCSINYCSGIRFETHPKTDVNKIINLFINPLSNNKEIKFTNIKKYIAKKFHNVCIDLSKNAKMIPSLVFRKIKKKYYNKNLYFLLKIYLFINIPFNYEYFLVVYKVKILRF